MPLWIVTGIISVFIMGNVIAGIICWHKLALPNMKSLSEDELKACRKIIEQGKGYPFVCKYALKKGTCPCLPCMKMEAVKEKF